MFLKYLFTINTLKHITLFKIRCYSYMFRCFWTILRECYVPSIEVASSLYFGVMTACLWVFRLSLRALLMCLLPVVLLLYCTVQ